MVEQLSKVLSRTAAVADGISMWCSLHTDRGGKLAGWLVDTWTERNVEPHLRPKLHWIPRADGKFYVAHLRIDFRSALIISDEDTDMERHRAEFIKATLALWEEQWLEDKAKGT